MKQEQYLQIYGMKNWDEVHVRYLQYRREAIESACWWIKNSVRYPNSNARIRALNWFKSAQGWQDMIHRYFSLKRG
jgi:hypothetical protein